MVHVDLMVLYSKYIIQQHPGGAIIKKNVSLTCMMMINPTTGWSEIVKVPTYDLDEVPGVYDDYIDDSSDMVSQVFNNTWRIRYLRPRKSMFNNGYEFKRDFTTLLKDFNIKPVLTTIKNPQDNTLVESVYQEILYMLLTKDISNKVFEYIYSWGETLACIAC